MFPVSIEEIMAAFNAVPESDPTDEGDLEDLARLTGPPCILYPHQDKVFSRIIRIARAFGDTGWHDFSVNPGWDILLVAPTGTGKSFLANAVAQKLGWHFLHIYTNRWIVAGGRGTETWASIADWLVRRSGNCLIFLDEIDKIHHGEVWSTHLRAEVFQLLDRNLPADLPISDPDSNIPPELLRSRVSQSLNLNTLIIAAGAFQDIWNSQSASLGFSKEIHPENAVTPQLLKKVLPEELINRFMHFLVLPPLTETDYRDMIDRAARTLPPDISRRYRAIAEKNMAEALGEGKGARFSRECLSGALLEADSIE